MARLFKNKTAEDVSLRYENETLVIKANTELELTEYWTTTKINSCDDLIAYLAQGVDKYQLNDGSNDLTVNQSLELLRGWEQAGPTPVKLVESNLLDPDHALSKTQTHYVTVKASQLVTEQDITYPYPIDAGAARYFIPADESRVKSGDRFDVIGIPGGDPFVGFVTANVAQGETVIPVSSTVFEYLRHGLNLKFASHAKDYEIMAEDTVAGTLTLKEGLEQAISIGDLIHIRRVMFGDMTPNKGVVVALGDLSTGSSGLCANAKLRIRYRCSVEPTEDFVLGFELIYSY